MSVQKENTKSLTDHSLSGFSWLAGRTVVTRIVQYGGQIVLAWLLEPKAFGLIGMAYSIQAFATLVQQSGIDKVLVAKQDEFDELANPGFWGALATGLVAGGLMFVSAPIAADMLNSPGLTEIILILAIATPFKALWLVPQSRLSIDLRFDIKAFIDAGAIVLQMALTIVLAMQGFGAQSFVLPLLLVNPLIAAVLYALTRPPLRWTPEFTKWPGIAKASGLLILAAVFNKAVFQGDYLILGAVYPEDTVGLYYMAFALSVQPIMLLANNVTNTLFPILSTLKDEWRRQRDAFVRAARVATVITVPASFFIAATAEPIVKLFLDSEWIEVVPILQVLAIGMALRVLEGMTYAFLNAQKRFRTIAGLALVRCILFFGLAVASVSFGVEWFAMGVAVAYFADSLLQIHVSLRFSWRSVQSVLRIIGLPMISSACAAVLSFLFHKHVVIDTWLWNLASILVGGVIFLAVVLGATAIFDSALWSELKLVTSKILQKARISRTAEAEA